MKITASTVKRLQNPERGQRLVFDTELRGFGVRLTPTSKVYIAEARVNGRTRRVKIGATAAMTATDARKQARTVLGDMARGIDPAEQKAKKKAAGVTLDEIATEYVSVRRKKDGKPLKPRTVADIERHVSKSFDDWQRRPVAEITRDDVRQRYTALCAKSVAQANQAMRVLSGLLNYARATVRAPDGTRLLPENPVAVLSDANLWQEVKPRETSVPVEKLGEWWSAVQARRDDPGLLPTGRTAVDLVVFLVLSGLRFTEAASLRWDSVDIEGARIRLSDTKNRSDIELPLSTQAVAILEARPRTGNGWVFPGRDGAQHMTDIRGCLRTLAEITGVTVSPHDLRRTYTRAGFELGIEKYRLDLLTNHKVPATDVTLKHYIGQLATRLRPETQRIADYYDQQRKVFEGTNVVPFTGSQEHSTGMAEPA